MTAEREREYLDALEQARALLTAGASLDDALGTSPPVWRDELRASLLAIARVEASAEGPTPAFTTALEGRLMAANDARVRRRRGLFVRPLLWRVGAAVAAVVLAFGVSGFAAVQASQDAIPGDVLYPVKETREAIEVFLARSDSRAARTQLVRLATRQRELELALERDAPPRVVIALEQGVANAASQLVGAALRIEAAGDPRAVALATPAIVELRARIDALAATEASPPIAVTLRRMSNFLAGQEQALRHQAPPAGEPPPRPTEARPSGDASAIPSGTRPARSPTPPRTRP